MIVRGETPSDVVGIHQLNRAAFGQPAEANIVDALRRNGKLTVSFVAEEEGSVVGHIALSRVSAEPAAPGVRVLGLGPLAVLSGWRNRGVGEALVRGGLESAGRLGFTHVVVLGGDYYHRFGFVPAQRYGIRSEYDAGEHFMILPLGNSGMPAALAMTYEPEFAEAGC